MKIRFIIIESNILEQVRVEIDMLRNAIAIGDMEGMDAATMKLLTLTTDCRSLDLSEKEWRKFLAEIRCKESDFQSDYLLPGKVCSTIFPEVTASDFVLELPIDEEA